MRKQLVYVSALVAATTIGLSATASAATTSSGKPLVVGATAVPHADILAYVKKNLAKKAGLKIKVVEFSDYVQPNEALKSKKLDVNFFQHKPYLDDQTKKRGYKFQSVGGVHIEPLGIYSKKVKSLDAISNGSKVAIPNDVTNGGRALALLAAKKLITLRTGVGTSATSRDITSNPKNLQIVELEAAQLPRALDDVAAAVINGNFALQAKLSPAKDALALESPKGNPYVNLVVARKDNAKDPRIKTLVKLLKSKQTKAFITKKYKGSVIPAS